MKKVSAGQFQRSFSKMTAALSPSESVMITKRGKPLGVFTKQPNCRIRTPDFLRNLKKLGHSKKLGDEILKEFYGAL
jgi:hypothetical protein